MIPSFQNVRHGLTEHHIQCHTLTIIFFYASLAMTIKLTLTSDKSTFRYKSNGAKFISYNLQIYKYWSKINKVEPWYTCEPDIKKRRDYDISRD
jgi:hypothetical protein